MKLPTSGKSLQRHIGFVKFYRRRQYIPRLAEKFTPFSKQLQKDVKFQMTHQHKDTIFEINENLAKAAKLSLRLPLPDKHLVIMCDASEHAAGYVLLTEDYTESDTGAIKSFALVVFGSQLFREGQISLTMYAKEFLAMRFAFDEFAHIIWGVKNTTIVMTDNKAVTRFFQTKRIPPKLSNSSTLLLLTSQVPKTMQLTTCHGLTSDRGNRYTSNSTMKSLSTTLRSICHPQLRSKMNTKRTTYLMMTPPPQSSTMPSTLRNKLKTN